ncbi:MAG: tetratricopeptide repeat protein [Armatimonadota bacterium]
MIEQRGPRIRRAVGIILAVMLLSAPVLAASIESALETFRQGYYEQAARQLKTIIDTDPGNLSAIYWLARSELATGAAVAAQQHFQEVLRHKPQSVESRYWLGEALAAQGRRDEAIQAFKEILAEDASYAAARGAIERLEATPANMASFDAGGLSGFTASGISTDVNTADLLSRNVYDYTFSQAPTDWLMRSGEWNATNRWTCSPQWSWFGGYEPDGIAAMWNKREFVGDIVVEMYAAFKMRLHRQPNYLPPNDINITICGDGANPDSGYSFIIGGYGNTVTMITKGDRILAQTSDPEALWPITENGQPPTYEWHRKWWGIRACKSGNTLQLYMDNQLVLEAEDDQPLQKGHVGIWVLNRDMITPRIKIYYADEQQIRSPIPAETVIQPPEGTAPITVTSKSHPSIQNDFENAPGSFEPRDEDQGALLAIDDRDGGGKCLKLVNRAAGGSFGATIHKPTFDAKDLSRLSFDYRISPDCRVNFYLTHDDETYEIVFTGPDEPARTCLPLGRIPNVKADGHWHHAEFDLLGHLQARHPGRSSYECSDLWIGNSGNAGYLKAGFGGNRMNATWQMDNFFMGHGGGSSLQLVMSAVEQKVPGYAVSVDRNPHGTPPEEINCTEQSETFDLDEDGTWYAHIRPNISEDEWGPVVHHRADVDTTPPAVGEVTPAPGTPVADTPIRIELADGGSGIDFDRLAVNVNDETLEYDGDAVRWDPAAGLLTVDPTRAGLVMDEGASLAVQLDTLRDRAGNEAESREFVYTISHGEDRSPPAPPQLSLDDFYVVNDDFEDGFGEWSAYGGDDSRLYLDDTTSADGSRSLKIVSTKIGGRFGARVTKKRFEAGRHRIVSFDYKAGDRVRADFAVYVNGDLKGIKFLDNDSNIGVIGTIPDIVADNRWHHAEFNLYDMLKEDDPEAETYEVRQFLLADWGQTGSRIGANYNIDNFRIIPVVSGREPLEVEWDADDGTGVAGVSWSIDTTPGMPDRSIRETASVFEMSLPEIWRVWVSLRAQDRAGNWGDATKRELLVDSQLPYANIAGPVDSAVTAVSEIAVVLADKGLAEIDPNSVVLQVDGKKYSTDNTGLRYHRRQGHLVWNCENVSPSPVVFKDGATVNVKLLKAADYAGNEVAELPQWSWTMDYDADREGPPIRELTSPTHPTIVADTFETGTGQWRSRGGEKGGLVSHDTETAASGNGSLKLTNRSKGGNMSALIVNEPFSAEKYNTVSFDYKVSDDVSLDFQFHMDGRWWPVTFTDDRRHRIGAVAGVKADGQWRHASFNIGEMLRERKKRGALTVNYVVIEDRNQMDNSAGAVAHFDNFIIGQVGDKTPTVRWKATDATGITAYSYVTDREPATDPDTTSEGLAVAKQLDVSDSGLWFFHLRARDGAGNWGPTRTYPLMHKKP